MAGFLQKSIDHHWQTEPKQIAFSRKLEKELETEKSLYIPLDQRMSWHLILKRGIFPEQGDKLIIGGVRIKEGQMRIKKIISFTCS